MASRYEAGGREPGRAFYHSMKEGKNTTVKQAAREGMGLFSPRSFNKHSGRGEHFEVMEMFCVLIVGWQ